MSYYARKERDAAGLVPEEGHVVVYQGGWTTSALPTTNWDGPLDQTSSQLAHQQHVLYLRDRLFFSGVSYQATLVGTLTNYITLVNPPPACKKGWLLMSFEMNSVTVPYEVRFTPRYPSGFAGTAAHLEIRSTVSRTSQMLLWPLDVIPLTTTQIGVQVDTLLGTGTIANIHQVAYFHPEISGGAIVDL